MCHNIVEKLRESILKRNRRMGTRLYLAGFAKEQRKSRVAPIATCIALDLCCSEAIIKRSECPFESQKTSSLCPAPRCCDTSSTPRCCELCQLGDIQGPIRNPRGQPGQAG